MKRYNFHPLPYANLCFCFAWLQRYDIVNGVVEVDGVTKEPTSENVAEGEDSDGMNQSSHFLLEITILMCC